MVEILNSNLSLIKDDLLAVARKLEWNWVKATPKDIEKVVRLLPIEVSDQSDPEESEGHKQTAPHFME